MGLIKLHEIISKEIYSKHYLFEENVLFTMELYLDKKLQEFSKAIGGNTIKLSNYVYDYYPDNRVCKVYEYFFSNDKSLFEQISKERVFINQKDDLLEDYLLEYYIEDDTQKWVLLVSAYYEIAILAIDSSLEKMAEEIISPYEDMTLQEIFEYKHKFYKDKNEADKFIKMLEKYFINK